MSYYQQTRRKPPRNMHAFSTVMSSRKRKSRRVILSALAAIIVVAGILIVPTWRKPSQMVQVAASENAAESSVALDLDGDWVSADDADLQLTLSNGRYQFQITYQDQHYTEEGTIRQQGTSLNFAGDGSPSAITYIGYGNHQLMLQWNNRILILTRNP